MNDQQPVVSFQPDGREAFLSLMSLMVGMNVEITYLDYYTDWEAPNTPRKALLKSMRGEIVMSSDDAIFLCAYGLPKRYSKEKHARAITWGAIRMVEVLSRDA